MRYAARHGGRTEVYNAFVKGWQLSREAPVEERAAVRRFVKPGVDEMAAYISEMGYHLDAEQIYDHYEQVGWVYGKGQHPIKDWKAAIRTWNKNEKRYEANRRPIQPSVADNIERAQRHIIEGLARSVVGQAEERDRGVQAVLPFDR